MASPDGVKHIQDSGDGGAGGADIIDDEDMFASEFVGVWDSENLSEFGSFSIGFACLLLGVDGSDKVCCVDR